MSEKADGSSGSAPSGGGRPKPYLVIVSFRFLCLSLASSILLAFAIGRAARIILLEGPRRALLVEDPLDSSMYDRPDYHESVGTKKAVLPEPVLADGKEAPKTVYSSKQFSIDETATSSSVHIKKNLAGNDKPNDVCEDGDGEKCGKCSRGGGGAESNVDVEGEEGGDDDEEHLPAGQHLLVDIKNVDGSFLNSEERLARAMVNVVNDSKLTLLSYHCHSLIPMGVSCVGVLLESHVSFHTWPDEGVITLDLFTCGSNPLVPTLPVIERLFAVPRRPQSKDEVLDPPAMVWAHKLRGFRSDDTESIHDGSNPLGADLGKLLLDIMDFDMKKEIFSGESTFQRIDVYEVIRPRFRDLLSYRRSLSTDGSYESLHPELYRPDRVLFLDGVMQSSMYGDEPYHEALVHPGMFSHPDPKRVAIIGGGEGATLREVLKHKTVEKAVMVEIDQFLVEQSHLHLPSWSNCSNLVGSADWCVEDKRSEMHYEDALAWFINRYGDGASSSNQPEPFDVIIMDALDPHDSIPFAEALYNNKNFLQSLYNSLSENGVFIMQLGEANSFMDAPDSFSRMKNRMNMLNLMDEVGFESSHVYEEGHAGFLWPWSYIIAFKDFNSRALWYSSVAEFETRIHGRVMPTKDGKSPLKYFDGATMKSYQVPHRVVERVFCRQQPAPKGCESVGFKGKESNTPASSFVVGKSRTGEQAGIGVFAKDAIKKGSVIAGELSTQSIRLEPSTTNLIENHCKGDLKDACAVEKWMRNYGSKVVAKGTPAYWVESGINTFVNHASSGESNVGDEDDNKVTDVIPSAYNAGGDSIYQPQNDRHLISTWDGVDIALRDIAAGEEILCTGEKDEENVLTE